MKEFPPMYDEAVLSQEYPEHKVLRDLTKRWLCDPCPNPVVLFGVPGCGKTFYSIALYRKVSKCISWSLYTNSFDLDNELLTACKSWDDHEDRVIAKYAEVPVLIWDDLGVERVNERTQRQYYAIIDARMTNRLRTLITSNLSPKTLGETLGPRISSRLGFAEWLEFPRVDFRKTENWV